MKSNKILLTMLISVTSLCGITVPKVTSHSNNVVYATDVDVTNAKTLNEKLSLASDYLTLNIDLNNVVTNIRLPKTSLYSAVVTYDVKSDYVEINDAGNLALITRPAYGSEAVTATITATITIKLSKDEIGTTTKDFAIRILPKSSSSNDVKEENIYEDFTAYETGIDLSEYLSWSCSNQVGQAKIVENVPNNDVINGSKVLEVSSVKSTSTLTYNRSFYKTGTVAFEGYFMYTGKLNQISFELGRNDIFGPKIGIDHNGVSYYSNSFKTADNVKTKECVWYKFRIEANSSLRSYSAYMYDFDGNNGVTQICKNVAYTGSDKFLSQLRISIGSGSNIGKLYTTNLKIESLSDFPIFEEANPNRANGIGKIEGFEECVLNYKEDTFTPNSLKVYNRFNDSQLFVEGVDYSLKVTSAIDSSDPTLTIYTYEILLSTGETKILTQYLYSVNKENSPEIESFKGSHLSEEIQINANGDYINTGKGYITFSGKIRRNDSKIYYALVESNHGALTADEILNTTDAIAKGDFDSSSEAFTTASDFSFSIKDLSLSKEYSLYVVAKNNNGFSKVYTKENITTVINITSCEEFYDMSVNVDTYKSTFRLMNDLDFSSYEWVCSPDNMLKFQGTLDGNGHTISNLNISSPYRKAAIFFEATNATIKNITFDNPYVEGLQDSAILIGYSNGCTITNVTFNNPVVKYNGEEGSEGYFAILIGRCNKETSALTNIIINNGSVTANKYSGILTGNVNKDGTSKFICKNIFVTGTMDVEGAAVGLIGRNRGYSSLENVYADLKIKFAKKEMGIIAGHNKEGGKLFAKNVIGRMEVVDCTQPTYFNNFIGSHDKNTSSYSFENVSFFDVDYTDVFESRNPVVTAISCGNLLSDSVEKTQRFYEENTFISCFETDHMWDYDPLNCRPVLNLNKVVNVTADQVNELIGKISSNNILDSHYYIYKALKLYESCSNEEKAKVNYQQLSEYKASYEAIYNALNSFTAGL